MISERPVVLVTGTSRGIGHHLARNFLESDWCVVGCSRSDYDGLSDPRYSHHALDIGAEREVVDLFRSVRATHGRLDVAVNNAAHNPARSILAMTTASALDATFATNVRGPFLVCREAVKLMMRRKFGRIVNLGSMATRHDVQGEAAYTASKAALGAMTRVLAREVAEHGITCNVVAPAAVETELMAAVDAARLEDILARNALPGVGSVADVSAAVDWLVSPAAGAVTGQTIYLGGA